MIDLIDFTATAMLVGSVLTMFAIVRFLGSLWMLAISSS
jgi:hypothetical protein